MVEYFNNELNYIQNSNEELRQQDIVDSIKTDLLEKNNQAVKEAEAVAAREAAAVAKAQAAGEIGPEDQAAQDDPVPAPAVAAAVDE